MEMGMKEQVLSPAMQCRTAALGTHLEQFDQCQARARLLRLMPKPALPKVPVHRRAPSGCASDRPARRVAQR